MAFKSIYCIYISCDDDDDDDSYEDDDDDVPILHIFIPVFIDLAESVYYVHTVFWFVNYTDCTVYCQCSLYYLCNSLKWFAYL